MDVKRFEDRRKICGKIPNLIEDVIPKLAVQGFLCFLYSADGLY